MPRATHLAQLLQSLTLKPGDWAVDATVGNGHDTLWLAEHVGRQGYVFGFDVQEAALASTAQRVADCPHVVLFHCGHEHLAQRLPPQAKGQLKAVMFNLGYLPGAEHKTITRPDTTLASLTQALAWLAPDGLITVVVYPGHPGGDAEAATVCNFAQALPSAFSTSRHMRLNTRSPAPELIAIKRIR